MSDVVLIKFLLSSAVIVLSLIIIYYLVNRFFPGYLSRMGREINVVSALPLGKDKGLVLVKVKDKLLLIGYDNERLHLLKEWDDEKINHTPTYSASNSGDSGTR